MKLKELVKTNIKEVVVILLITAAISYSVYQNQKTDDLIAKNARYVIGQIIEVNVRTHGQMIDYEYRFGNLLYKNRRQYNLGKKGTGKHFLVKVSAEKPEISNILMEEYIPTIHGLVQPDSGWINKPRIR